MSIEAPEIRNMWAEKNGKKEYATYGGVAVIELIKDLSSRFRPEDATPGNLRICDQLKSLAELFDYPEEFCQKFYDGTIERDCYGAYMLVSTYRRKGCEWDLDPVFVKAINKYCEDRSTDNINSDPIREVFYNEVYPYYLDIVRKRTTIERTMDPVQELKNLLPEIIGSITYYLGEYDPGR